MPGSPLHDADRLYVSPAEFSSASGLSMSTVRRYLSDGRLPKAQPGGHRGRILIPLTALEILLVDHQALASEPATTTVNATSVRAPEKPPTALSGPQPRWLNRSNHTKD